MSCAYRLLSCLGLLVLVHHSARANVIVVDSADDGLGGACTLRAAVVAANTDEATGGCPAGSSGRDEIVLPSGVYTLRLGGTAGDLGDLDIFDDLTITGSGSDVTIIQACTVAQQELACPPGEGMEDRIFEILGANFPEVEISGVTLRHGRPPPSSGGRGGAVQVDQGSLTLVDCVIADSFGGGISAGTLFASEPHIHISKSTISRNVGGGIFQVGGTLDLADSTISENSMSRAGGLDLDGVAVQISDVTIRDNRPALGGTGGVRIHNIQEPATLTRCVIRGNSGAKLGGGIAVTGGRATVTESTISGNSGQFGGGVRVSGAVMEIERSTISGNVATVDGGGVSIQSGSIVLLNSTVSGDQARRAGGGISVNGSSSRLELNNVTITGNTANEDGLGSGGGLHHAHVGGVEILISNTIIAGNEDLGGVAPDIGGSQGSTPASLGFNLFGDLTGASILPQESDIFDVDPLLAPLADNGGPTMTHALLAGSPALDAGDPAIPSGEDATCEVTDQRGEPRPSGSACDIGALETQIPDLIITSGPLVQRQLGVETTQRLRQSGAIDTAMWSIVTGSLPAGLELDPDGVVHGTPRQAGEFPVAVEVEDGEGRVAEKEIVYEIILTRPPPDIRIVKFGTQPVRGREVHYFISVRNEGDDVARGIRVAEFLEPWFHIAFVDPIPQAVDMAELRIRGEDVPLPVERTIYWDVPDLDPGGKALIHYSAVLNRSVPAGMTVSGTVGEITEITPEACDTAFASEMKQALTLCTQACDAIGDLELILMLKDLSEALLTFNETEMLFFVQGELGAAALTKAGDLVFESPEDCAECFGVNQRFAEHRHDLCKLVADIDRVFNPVDPNEKLVLAERFIPPEQELIYPIHFENVGEIEARDVFVSDPLAPELDLASVQVLSPDAGEFVALPPGETVMLRRREGVRVVDVDGEPIELPYVELWTARLDAETRTVFWSLENIDLAPGDGDTVFVAATPLPDLPSGTEIRNTAEIRFEVEEPLTTNEVVNVVDTTPPVGSLDALPAVSQSPLIPLSWSGTDEVGEIEHFTVLVATDGGDFEPLFDETEETSAVFEGEDGRSYEFVCVATDLAGNVEAQQLEAESATTVRVPTLRRGDCNDDGRVDISDAVSTLGSLFLGDGDPACDDACDSNDDGTLDISDAINTLGALFLGNGEIPLPGVADCGVDPTVDELACGAGCS